MEKNIDKKLANKISYQIWYKGCLKWNFVRVVQICEGGSISVRKFGRGGGQNPRGVQIRYDTGIFETITDIDDFTICPTHIDVG